jgi:ribosome-associated protein
MPKKKSAKIDLKDAIIIGMLEKKANDITVLDLRKLKTSMADYFIVCHGNSDKQVSAIADSVEEQTKKLAGERAWHVEGSELNEWVLLDYFDIVVHVFMDEKRGFYGIEDLWSDADITVIKDERDLKLNSASAEDELEAKPAKAKAKVKAKSASKEASAVPKAKAKAKKPAVKTAKAPAKSAKK